MTLAEDFAALIVIRVEVSLDAAAVAAVAAQHELSTSQALQQIADELQLRAADAVFCDEHAGRRRVRSSVSIEQSASEELAREQR